METIILAGVVAVGLTLQIASAIAAGLVIGRRPREKGIEGHPGVSVLRPLCGLENNLEETLRTTFGSRYEGPIQIVFCVQHDDDPAVPLARRLIAEHPQANAQLLVGDERVSGNPKLNNLIKGWAAAHHDFVLMVDSNVLLPSDYVERLLECWTPGTGLVTSPPAGLRPDNFWGRLECAFLNTYEGRWQLAAEAFGNGFAQGKVLFWRRDMLEAAGGLAMLGRDMAEDVASTKLVRRAGLKVRLIRELWPQPVGSRSASEVWQRQLRWARVRRLGFPAYFVAEILTGVALPLLAVLALTVNETLPSIAPLVLLGVWFGTEWLLARLAGWPASLADLGCFVLRDLLLPALWLASWLGRGFEWRGNTMHIADVTAPRE